MRRLEQVNKLLKNKLAYLISREIPLNNGLITIVYIDTAPDLIEAKIGISVLPFNLSESVIKKLRKYSSHFSQIIQKETKLRRVPKFKWTIDETEEKATAMEEIFKKIEGEK